MLFTDLLREFGGPFLISLVISSICALPIYRLLLAMNARQTVSEYAPEGHQAKQGTPTSGGLICVAGILAGLIFGWIFSAQEAIDVPPLWRVPLYKPLLLLTVGFAAIGFIDDFVVPRMFKGKRGLGWKQKILLQFFFALPAVPAIGLEPTAWNAAVCVFVILFFANAYNFVDGLDGLAGSVGVLLFLGFVALSAVLAQGLIVWLVAGLVVGSLIPFLFLNAPPAKLFMGDVGSLAIGSLAGVAFLDVFVERADWPSRWYHAMQPVNGSLDAYAVVPTVLGNPALISLLILSLIMVVELVPVPLQILSVKLRKKRLFPYTPIHHAFEKAAWPESRVVWSFALVQLLCVAFALLAATRLVPPEMVQSSQYYYLYSVPSSRQ